MQISLTSPFQRAWDHMVKVLFKPIEPAKWFALGFTAWLAHLANSSGGGGGGSPGGPGPIGHDLEETIAGTQAFLLENLWVVFAILCVFVVVVAIVLLVTWLSSRGKFMFLDNVVHNRAEVKAPWRRFQTLGDSLFAFRVAAGLVIFAIGVAFFGLGGWGAYLAYNLEAAAPLVIVGVFLALGFLLFMVSVGLYAFFQDAFVVPIMYRYELAPLDAWRRFLPLLSAHRGSFISCALFVFALAILMLLGILVIGFMTCCIGFVLLAIPYISAVFMLPVTVTYRAFTVEYLGQFDDELKLIENSTAVV